LCAAIILGKFAIVFIGPQLLGGGGGGGINPLMIGALGSLL
jgi:Na+-translocating ferredoxin:NAD+ oxidoreductase RnfD subunit